MRLVSSGAGTYNRRIIMLEEEQPSIRTYEGARSAEAPLLVVAIGASAGGLDALRELFDSLAGSVGMAFVVIEHTEGVSRSLLPSVLRQFTSIPVQEISEGQVLAPDQIFVAPANASVELDRLTFRVSQALGPEQRRAPIDTFFRSLASAFGTRSVGVILSGSGTDGMVGTQQIAHEGGMTLAQRPEHARHDGMPRSAIATGVVDHVLDANEMAGELLAYAGHLREGIAEEGALEGYEAVLQTLPEICDLLHKTCEHNFKHYKTSTLVRRIQRRMQVLRIDAAESYLDRLRQDTDELTQLFRELLVGVTAFFRDPAAFDVLASEVVKPLLSQRRHDSLRFWVPGCASGEEAYSLAMVALEAMAGLTDPPSLQIFATDIDERALSVARQGIYPASIAGDVSAERLERFFAKKGKRYQIAKEVRELCMFSPHNLIGDPPFSRLDLISCRNLLIYFGPHLQQKVIPLFHYALRQNGYLFLGPSENISTHKELFSPVNAKYRISQRKATPINASAMISPDGSSRGGPRVQPAGGIVQPDLYQLMQRMLLDEFAPKALIVTEEGQILSASGAMDQYLSVTEGTFQNNVIRLARPGLRVGLRAALSEAIKSRRKVVHDKVSVQVDSGIQRVSVTVQPMPRLGQEVELFLVVFQDLGALLPREEGGDTALSAEADSLIEQLERELANTRDDLEKTIQDLEAANEELKSSNEELLSMNEELQSANEELETSKEEVQASNEALARAHANLANLLTSTMIATIFLDDALNIQSFTPAVANVYNVMPSDIGRPLAHITHRCEQMPPLPTPAELRGCAEPREDELVTDDGSCYLRRCHPYQTHEGKAEGLVVTFLDVTQIKRARELSRQHERQLQLITDALPVLISYVDPQQRYVFNNLAYERWFGLPRDSLRGRQVREVIGESAYQTAAPNIARALSGEPIGYEGELPFRDGRRMIRAEYVPDLDEQGQVRGYVSLKYDVSEERRLAQSLAEAKVAAEQANLAKSDFLANMSHEIRTPLTSILGYGELLQSHTTDPDNLACIDAIRRNGKYLIEIINDILDLSKIEAGMLHTELVRVSPGGVLRDVVDSLRVRAAEKGLTLDIIHEGPLPATIESDPTRLRQVLLNLLSNAIKFTEQGRVLVSARLLESERLLQVAVKDTGIGISPERLSHLFAPFTQADSSINRRYGGTGLGLAICRRLVEMLGGSISVQSAEGQGSTFTFTVSTGPLDEVPLQEEAVPPPVVALPPLSRLDGKRVLIVDDRRDMRYLIQTYVEEAGASAESAGDGAVAIERVQQARAHGQAFDAIVLDMQMPVMDGFRAAPALRAAGHTGLIIALTANAMKGDAERCLSVGCDEYLSKPVDRLRLLHLLAQGKGGGELASAPPAAGADVPVPPAARSFRQRVLIVDDNPDATELLSVLLDSHDLEAITAKSGAEAVERARATRPQVVVLDLGLPDMDGYAVLEHLQAIEDLRSTRFIALTGRSMPEDKRRMKEAGFHHQLVKPPDLQHLIELIKGVR
ncbi:MAG TPA: CheR family methyltransferase [Polyangiaceae bacterium]|nr:CheR family methyltransferase [Polyangiaceae bacterium]